MRCTMIGLVGALLFSCVAMAQPPNTQPPGVQPPAIQPPNATPGAGFRGRGFQPPAIDASGRRGAPDGPDGARRTAPSQLDGPPLHTFPPLPESAATGKLLFLEVLVADVTGEFENLTAGKILEMEREGRLSGTARIRLTSLENQPAFVQFGERAPRVTGATVTPRGTTPVYSDVQVGTLVQATTRLESDGTALVQFYLSKSSIAKATNQEGAAERIEPQPIVMVTAQSAVRVKPGEPVLISTGPSSTPSVTQTWIVLSFRVL